MTKVATAVLRIAPDDRLPGWTEFVRAAKASLAQTALDQANGNQSAAAKALGVNRATLRSALEGFEVGEPPDLWEDMPVGTYDASQFPFIRTRWHADPTEAFIDEYKDWALGTILPRCAREGVKVVVLEDCSAWTQLPSLRILTKLSSTTKETDALVREHVIGIIGFLPNIRWTTWFNPMLSLTAIPHRFACTEDQVLGFATSLFEGSGVPSPPITLDS